MSQLSIAFDGSDNSPLMRILMQECIEPGTEPGYQLCKDIYLSHPLGAKMADAPISMAQSQSRTITVQNAPEEVVQAYKECWDKLQIDDYIHNAASLSRVYGLSSVILGCRGKPTDQPIDMEQLWKEDIYFNVLDPLNTSGSLVLNQIPTSPDFAKPVSVSVNGQKFHSSRFQVLMNESPVYIAYTVSAFGFVGRSVYQRALFPLKSFINTMIVDDTITTKNGVLVAKRKSPGSVLNKVMTGTADLIRRMLKQAHTGQVVQIDPEEAIESLNMQNVDGAGTFARNNILKNIATAADMPAKLLENETLVQGFGEGTEDAKTIAAYIDGIRKKLNRIYRWFDNVVMYRAWSPEFYVRLQKLYPDEYSKRDYRDVFSEWRRNFNAEWPSLLREPESELVKVDAVKFEALIATIQTILPRLDPFNIGIAIQWLTDTVSENKRLFHYELTLDIDQLVQSVEEDKERMQDMQEQQEEIQESQGVAKKVGKFDSAQTGLMDNLRRAVAQLPHRSFRHHESRATT